MMEAKDVLNLPWKKVKDWSELPITPISRLCGNCVHLRELELFIDKLYQTISLKLDIPYEDLLPILVSENEDFYRLMEQLFRKSSDWYYRDSCQLHYLQNLLMVPDVDYIVSNTEPKVDFCLKLFEELSDREKIEFLQKIEEVSKTIPYAVN